MQGANTLAVGIENGAGRCLINQMRNLILSALILASAFQTALGQTDWSWDSYNQGIAIHSYRGSGGAVTIPSSINGIPVVRLKNSGGGGYAIFY